MILDDYNSLYDIWKELCQEVEEIEAQIQYNLQCIKEKEIYVDDFLKYETEDFRVFSPRKAEVIHKEEIEEANIKKMSYLEQNEELYLKKDLLDNRIKKLEAVLNRQDRNYTFLNIQEEDRQRIARELHDTSLQNLAHLIHKIELSTMYIDRDPIQAKLELSVIRKRLKETIYEIRGTIFDLRPMTFDDLGLKPALERLLININGEGKYDIISEIEEITCDNNLILLSLYRVVQESFCNIEKHAHADKIVFRCMEREGRCILFIEDNGKGFLKGCNDGERHFGISLMKERVELLNGNIEIISELNKGTRVSIEIPLDMINVKS